MLRRAISRAAGVAASRSFASSGAAAAQAEFISQINKHRSNAQELIQKVPVIEVEANVALCDGGGGATGHPIEYIQLNKRVRRAEASRESGRGNCEEACTPLHSRAEQRGAYELESKGARVMGASRAPGL